MYIKKIALVLMLIIISNPILSQEDTDTKRSVIQDFTPSILLKKGQWDIKWFNNLYTETQATFGGNKSDIPRNTFFTSTVDVFTGISDNRRVNLGLLLEFRSNVIGGRDALDIFSFDGENGTARSGLTSFAPAIKFNPVKSLSNFTIQSAFHIPLVGQETKDNVFLDQSGFIFQNRFFYDYSFQSGNWQLFTELNTEYNFKKDNSFASNSLRLIPGAFLSYFPSSKFTVLGFVQHLQLISFETNGFEQDATILGGGAKYQLTNELNIEFLYSNFVRGNDTGLGSTYNIGLRALF
ncbi:hypothetical protein FBALC1_10327 [Flavobacteriales bacterium ALC-1]|nr:hypothetical protein FBALC1_10327 [Flavobacteriales bacterium ALC-1]